MLSTSFPTTWAMTLPMRSDILNSVIGFVVGTFPLAIALLQATGNSRLTNQFRVVFFAHEGAHFLE